MSSTSVSPASRRRFPPWPIAVLSAIALGFFAVPVIGLLLETPWSDLAELLTSQLVLDAARVSVVSSLSATAISALLGIPLAWVLARVEFPGRAFIRALVLLPMVLPPVVGGAALLFAFGRRGVLGEPVYEATGLVLPFSIWGVIVAVTFVSMPFMILTVEGSLRGLDRRFENAAATLGASRMRVVRRVTLPLIAPSIGAGLLLTWARALGEFGATITFAGSLPGRTQTLPLAVFFALETDREAAIALSLGMVVVAVLVILLLRDRWLRTS